MFIKLFFFFLIINATIGFLQLWIDDSQATALADGKVPVNLLWSQDTNSSLNYVEGQDFASRDFTDSIYNRVNNTGDNSSGTLAGDLANPANSSGAFKSADIFSEQSDIDAFSVWRFIQFFNGGFVLDSMDAIGGAIGMELPEGFVESMGVVIGFVFVLWMFFVITGRSFSSFT